MSYKRKFILSILVVVLFSFVTIAYSADKTQLTFITAGSVGGGGYTMGAGLSEMIMQNDPDILIKVVPGGAVICPVKVGKGEVPLGMGANPFDYMAMTGTGPFEQVEQALPGIRSIGGSFFDCNLHFVAPKNKNLSTLEEFIELVKSKKEPINIGTSTKGASDEFALRMLLKYYGLSYDDIQATGGKVFHAGYPEICNMYQDRHLDYLFIMSGVPVAAIVEAQISRDLNLLSFSPETVEYFNKNWAYSKGEKAIIKAGSYKGQDEDVLSPAMCMEVIVNESLSEDVVYRIVKIWCENYKELPNIHASMKVFKPEEGWKWIGVPLHPGAEKYYREMGYLKD